MFFCVKKYFFAQTLQNVDEKDRLVYIVNYVKLCYNMVINYFLRRCRQWKKTTMFAHGLKGME